MSGRISSDDIIIGKNEFGLVEIDKSSPEYINKREKIVQYLRKGHKNSTIRTELDISPLELRVYIKDIKDGNIMSSEEINDARERRKQENIKFIIKCINDDELGIEEILQLRTELDSNELKKIVKKLINDGTVNKEQIDSNAKKATKRSKNKSATLSPEEQLQFVLEKVRKGYSPSEIAKSDETKSITANKATYQRDQLIEQGIISKEEVKKAIQQRKEMLLQIKHQEDAKRLKEYIRKGETFENAATFAGISKAYAKTLRRECKENNTWISEEELQEIENRKKEENEHMKRNEIIQLRNYVMEGLLYEEISRIMGYGERTLTDLANLAKKENMWFTTPEINQFRRLREEREKLEAERLKKEEGERLKKEREESERRKQEEEERIRIEKERIEKEIKEKLKIRNSAQKEENTELSSSKIKTTNVSTEKRRTFLQVLSNLYKLHKKISNKDIEIALSAICMHPELANADNIKMLITVANKNGGIQSAERVTIELAASLRETEFYRPLAEYRRWIKMRNLLPEIKAMKNKGMSNSNISEKIGISSTEVSILLNNNRGSDYTDSGNR